MIILRRTVYVKFNFFSRKNSKNVYHVENMAFIDIEVKRPFPEEIGKEKFDVFFYCFVEGTRRHDV